MAFQEDQEIEAEAASEATAVEEQQTEAAANKRNRHDHHRHQTLSQSIILNIGQLINNKNKVAYTRTPKGYPAVDIAA